jgi:aspartate aminotransferase
MDQQLVSQRMARVYQALGPFLMAVTDPYMARLSNDPEACNFSTGNPQEMPVAGYVEALQRWLPPQNKDWFAYKMNEPEARQAVADSLSRWRKQVFAPEDIFLTTGAFSALALILNAVVDPGDEVIFVSPPWFFYEGMIISSGGTPVKVRVNPTDFDLDLEAIAGAITPRTRAIFINSPHNPTGKIYPTQTLKELGQILLAATQRNGRPLYLVSDEAYSRIIYDGRGYASPTSFYEHSFLVYTYGKTLLAPGMRIGYIALPGEMPEREVMRSALMGSQTIIGHAFPDALLQYALPDLEKLSIDVKHLEEKRDLMVDALGNMGYSLHKPEGTFYLLPRSPLEDDQAFVKLLAEYKILCMPGLAFDMPGYFRISLTANDEMIERSLAGFASALERARRAEKTGVSA